MKTKLSVLERIIFLGVMPTTGGVLDLRVSQDLRQRVGFDAKEQTELKMNQADNKVNWDQEKATEKEFEFELKEVEGKGLQAERILLLDK